MINELTGITKRLCHWSNFREIEHVYVGYDICEKAGIALL